MLPLDVRRGPAGRADPAQRFPTPPQGGSAAPGAAADGWPEAGLARAEELYVGLCAESPEDERLWTALFRIHERTGSAMGLESAVRRLRTALVELGADEAADIDSVPLPPNLDRLVQQIRQRIDAGAGQPSARSQ